MSFFKKILGQEPQAPAQAQLSPAPDTPAPMTIQAPATTEPRSHQLSSGIVNEVFGEVNVCRRADVLEVNFTILMQPVTEGWQTGVAIDASASMESLFGRGLEEGSQGGPPQSLLQ